MSKYDIEPVFYKDFWVNLTGIIIVFGVGVQGLIETFNPASINITPFAIAYLTGSGIGYGMGQIKSGQDSLPKN